MDTDLRKESYEYMALAWSGRVSCESSEEYVVPDTMPDVESILDADAVVTLRSKEAALGNVMLSASANVTVVYAPENRGPMRMLELSVPWESRADAPGADEECSTVVRLRVRSVEARAVNSRKIAVRVDIEADIRCYRRAVMEIATSLSDAEAPAHIRRETADIVAAVDVREKTFASTDEYEFPAECEGTESLLTRRVDAIVEDVQYVGGKAVFRGRVRSELVFTDTETGRVSVGKYETEFSQIMEVGSGESNAVPEVTLFLTGVYFDLPEYSREPGRITAEIHLGAQCVCRGKLEVPYIADIYSNRTELVPTSESLSVTKDIRQVSVRQTVTGRMEPLPSDGEILRTTASVGAVTMSEGEVKTTVSIRSLLRGADGAFTSARCRLSADFTVPEIVDAAQLENVTVTVIDAYSAGSSGEVRAVLQMNASVIESETLTCVNAVIEDTEAWQNRERIPSMTLLRTAPDAELWPIARRYHSTVAAIEAANEGRKGGLLLIPKGR